MPEIEDEQIAGQIRRERLGRFLRNDAVRLYGRRGDQGCEQRERERQGAGARDSGAIMGG
jgi:hypothetical protein